MIRQSKAQTLISRYSQLIKRRTDLEAELKNQMERLKEDSCHQETEQNEHKLKVGLKIQEGEAKLNKAIENYFDIGKLDKYLQ